MNEKTEQILDVLAQIANLVPEQRFGQILYNYLTRYYSDNDTFYAQDADVLNILKISLENLKNNIDKN